jgi:hypothetical protein
MSKNQKFLASCIVATLLSGSFFLFQSCQKDENENVDEQTVSSYEKPKQLITNDFAKQLTGNYTASRPAFAKGTNKIDANAVWYSLAELENYINYIKTEGKQKGYNVDGIRLYYGVYPENYIEQKKAGLTTIFLSPTGAKKNAKILQNSHGDIMELLPMNYGGLGNPPKIDYGQN